MDIDTLKDIYQDWSLQSYIDKERLGVLVGGRSAQVHAERMYSYKLSYSRGHVLINAWYHPSYDPYGEYPYEIQFFIATEDGEILKEVSIFEPDFDAQYATITEAMDDVEAFFWKRLSMKISDILPLLGTRRRVIGALETEVAVADRPKSATAADRRRSHRFAPATDDTPAGRSLKKIVEAIEVKEKPANRIRKVLRPPGERR